MTSASGKTKRLIAIVLAVLLVGGVALAAATTGLGKPGIPSGDVAIVDGVEGGTVSQEDFDRGLEQAAAQLGLKEVPPTDDPQYQGLLDQAMQELLLAYWVEGEAADRGITVTQEEIDAELARIKEQSFASEKEFEQFVERSKFTEEDVDNQVKLTLLRDRLEAEIVPEKPTISDDEVEDFYEVNIESFQQPASRDVRVILNSSEAKAEQAKAELEADDSDASWSKVAKKYSEDQASSDRGGLLEGLVEGQGDPQLEEQAFSAAEGEIVGPFETDRGFYVIQVTGITEETTQPLDEASPGDPPAARRRAPAADRQRLPDGLRRQVDGPHDLRPRGDDRALRQLRAGRARARRGPAGPAAGRLHPADRARDLDDHDRRQRPAGPAPGAAGVRAGDPRAACRLRPDRPRRPARSGRRAAGGGRRAPRRGSAPDGAPSGALTDPPQEVPEADEAAAARAIAALTRLDGITRRLRRECPWDRAQDERSIVPHTVEEAYELADAAAHGDDEKLLDELGDVLFQVHFLSLLLEERGAGDLAAVATGTTEKLIRRHPHVFGEVSAESSGEVLANWDRIKREQEGRDGLFEDVPENLPALLYARKLQRRASSRAEAGAELGSVADERPDGSLAAIERQATRLGELAARGAEAGPEAPAESRAEVEEALGEVLFACVDVARRMRCDPELALRAAAERFRARASGS